MASAATTYRLDRDGNSSRTQSGGIQRTLFGTPVRNTVQNLETGGVDTTGGNINSRGFGNNGSGGRSRSNRTNDERLSEDEVMEIEEPASKRVKQSEETIEVPAAFYGQIVGMLEGFNTKGTIWYGTPEAEKKRDKSAFVLWKGRTRPDGTMSLSAMDTTRTVREVIATEVSIAQQFRDIFDPNSASRIFELVGNGSNIQKAVFQTLNEQNETSSSD